jgi:hypothetical protein
MLKYHYITMNTRNFIKDTEKMFAEGKVSDELEEIDNMFYLTQAKHKFNPAETSKINDTYMEIYNNLPKELQILYSHIGDHREYSHPCGLIFKPLHKINLSTYSHFYDVAYAYAGLGHVHVIGYHPATRKYFQRMDGGSNGYDRADNYRHYKEYEPNEEELKNLKDIFSGFA